MFPQPRLTILLLVLWGLAVPSFAEKPKFATVNVTEAFEAHHRTLAEKARVREALAKLGKDPRNEIIQLLKVDIADLREEAQNPTISEAERTEYFRKHMMKTYERSSLRRERDESVREQRRSINEAMVKTMREILNEVQAVVAKAAVEGGYDFVFEKGGKTSSQIAPLIYIRDATDITDQVIELLNKDAPAKKEVATTDPKTR